MKHIVSFTEALLRRSSRHLWMLERELSAADPRARMVAVRELSTLSDPRVETLLLRALGDEDGWIRQAAAQHLGDGPSSVAALCDALEDEWIRPFAARSLARIGDASAVEPLLRALETPEKGAIPVVIEALAALGDPRAIPGLVALAREGGPWIAEAADAAIEALGGAEVHRRAA